MPLPATTAQVAFAPHRETDRWLPESPRRIALQGRPALAWVNIQTAADATQGHIHIGFLDSGERRRLSLPARPGFILPSEMPDTLIVGLEKAVGMLNLIRGHWTPFARIHDTHPRTIINDGEVMPGGRGILFGTKDTLFREPLAHLYYLSFPDQFLSPIADGFVCSNGKVILPLGDDALVFDIDSPRKLVERYFLDSAARRLTRDGTALDLRDAEGLPDGMVDCGDGTVIIAFFNPDRGGDGVARRYRLNTGEALEEWITPGSPRVTCPLLIEHQDQVKLVLTTAVEGMSNDLRQDSPNAGSLFIAETGLKSVPPVDPVRI
jgi:sugar lactone lactonase YvrE